MLSTIVAILCMVTPAIAQNDLGGLSPEQALEYMKTHENLVIIDTSPKRSYDKQHFIGATHIPIASLDDEQEKELYMKIPEGRPVLLHCRLGQGVLNAYPVLKRLRPDIPEISYIAGKPPFTEYNDWKSKN